MSIELVAPEVDRAAQAGQSATIRYDDNGPQASFVNTPLTCPALRSSRNGLRS
jgi:hypothetical protein